MNRLEAMTNLIVEMTALSMPDRRADANVIAFEIARHLDLLIGEAAEETAARVMAGARTLAESTMRVEAAAAEEMKSFTALCDAVSSAPGELFGRQH